MKPERKSDVFDKKLTELPGNYTRRTVVDSMLAVIILLNISLFVLVLHTASDTNQAVRAQIPGLKAQIKARDKTIADQDYIINKEAVPQLIKLAEQVKSLGGDPGKIILSSPKDK